MASYKTPVHQTYNAEPRTRWTPPADLVLTDLRQGEWIDDKGWIHYLDASCPHRVLFANDKQKGRPSPAL